jgi:hypothetical protein
MKVEKENPVQVNNLPEDGIRMKTNILTKNVKISWMLFAIIVIAGLPPMCVVLHRWFGTPILLRVESGVLCKNNFLCGLGMPDYFYIFFVCTFLLFGIFFAIRKDASVETLFKKSKKKSSVEIRKLYFVPDLQSSTSRWSSIVSAVVFVFIFIYSLISKNVPGWDLAVVILVYIISRLLADYDLRMFWKYVLHNYKWLTAILLSHLSLILLLQDLYSQNGFQWLWGVVFIIATVNLLRYHRFVKPIYWIISLALILFTLNLNNRIYAFVGDEFSFFNAGRYISQGQSFANIGDMLFHGTYVYEQHPYFSSLIQSIFMKLLGVDSFGWRFSNIYLSATSIGLFYLFLKRFCKRRIALYTAILLAGSEYLMSFDKIGYNNLQALFVMGLILALSAYAVQSKRMFGFTLLGASMALCFYVFPAALYILPVPILFLFFYIPPFSKQNICFWVIMIAPLSVCVFPLLLQFDYWQVKLTGTIFNTPAIVSFPQNLFIHFVSNIIFAFYSFLYSFNQTHFVFSSFVDPLSGMLVLIGFAALFSNFLRQKFVTFWTISFAILVFLVGSTHQEFYPSPTRMFLLLPFFAFFAALALAWFHGKLKHVIKNQMIPKMVVWIFLFVVVLLNMYQAYVKAPEFFAGKLETNFLSTIENVEKKFTDNPKTFIVITSGGLDLNKILAFQQVYGIPRGWDQLLGMDISQINGSNLTTDLIKRGNTFVIIPPFPDSSLLKNFEEQIKGLGQKLCQVTDRPGGRLQFDLLYPQGFDYACAN